MDAWSCECERICDAKMKILDFIDLHFYMASFHFFFHTCLYTRYKNYALKN